MAQNDSDVRANSEIVFTGPCSSIQAKNSFCSGFYSLFQVTITPFLNYCKSFKTIFLVSGIFHLWNSLSNFACYCVYTFISTYDTVLQLPIQCLVIYLDSKFIKNGTIFFNTVLLAHCKMCETYDKQNTIFSKQPPWSVI